MLALILESPDTLDELLAEVQLFLQQVGVWDLLKLSIEATVVIAVAWGALTLIISRR
jgi:hypothetical protein